MEQPTLRIDFKPTFTVERLVAKMESARRNFLEEAQVRWKLHPATCSILENTHGPFADAKSLALATKDFHLALKQPRPLEEAISSAGGVTWSELNHQLMCKNHPGLFFAGEMIDWEAPTGGYLLQGCFASGTLAAQSAHHFLTNSALPTPAK